MCICERASGDPRVGYLNSCLNSGPGEEDLLDYLLLSLLSGFDEDGTLSILWILTEKGFYSWLDGRWKITYRLGIGTKIKDNTVIVGLNYSFIYKRRIT